MELFERFAEFWLAVAIFVFAVLSAASMLEELSDALREAAWQPAILFARVVSEVSKAYEELLKF